MSDLETTIAERLGAFLEKNKVLTRENLPIEMEQKLVKCLLDGSVFSVVNSLAHLQDLKETELLNQRYRRVRELGDAATPEQIAKIDRNIVEQFDEHVHEQQSNFCCVGIPTFNVTKDFNEIKVQIEIIKFIQTLGDVYTTSS